MRVTGDVVYITDPYLGSTLAPDAQCFIQRDVTSEHVYTNNLGWRVEKLGEQAKACDLAFIGCSWPMGVGVEYQDCFAHQAGIHADMSVANLGVGSYSLLQAIRRLEKYIETIKPKAVVLTYGHWLINRCFKSNAMGDVILRPIYKRNTENNLVLVEPFNPSIQDVERFIELHRREDLGFMQSLYKRLLKTKITLKTKRFGLNFIHNLRYVEGSHEEQYFQKRQQVLKQESDKLQKLCAKNNTKLLVFHLHQYIKRTPDDETAIAQDQAFWADFANAYEHVFYQSEESMKHAIDKYMKGLDQNADLLDAIHCPDNNHPNSVGHRLIGEAIAKTLKTVL